MICGRKKYEANILLLEYIFWSGYDVYIVRMRKTKI